VRPAASPRESCGREARGWRAGARWATMRKPAGRRRAGRGDAAMPWNPHLRRAATALAAAAAVVLLASLPLSDVAAQRKGGGKPSGPGAAMPDPISHDSAGFTPIFD